MHIKVLYIKNVCLLENVHRNGVYCILNTVPKYAPFTNSVLHF